MSVWGFTSNLSLAACYEGINEVDAPVSNKTLVVSSPLVTERAGGLGLIRRLYAWVESKSADALSVFLGQLVAD